MLLQLQQQLFQLRLVVEHQAEQELLMVVDHKLQMDQIQFLQQLHQPVVVPVVQDKQVQVHLYQLQLILHKAEMVVLVVDLLREEMVL